MNVNAPKQITFLISLVIAILAVVGMYVNIPVISGNAAWAAIVAYVILAAGCLLPGL
jgi:hypothetical protein